MNGLGIFDIRSVLFDFGPKAVIADAAIVFVRHIEFITVPTTRQFPGTPFFTTIETKVIVRPV